MNVDTSKLRRLPAEWEEQDGVLLAWPHSESDWAPLLAEIERVSAAIIAAISRFERVILIVPDEDAAKERLTAAQADLTKIIFVVLPTNDTWARDFGPITVYDDGTPAMLDFGFNGWGLKFPAALDNRINRLLAEKGLFTAGISTRPLILEGGSIESDGNGTLLVTATCLLSSNRNPHLDRNQLELTLAKELGAEHILWLQHGYLAGDDTDAHVDTLARLCPDDTILYVACDNPADEHFQELSLMQRELEALRTRNGSPFRLLPLPMPAPSFDSEGERLPATYANFLIINGAVLVPTYNDPCDATALALICAAFPGREIIGIDCRPVLEQHGSLHCLTMQLPKGTLP
jgi:agmatine deiminase